MSSKKVEEDMKAGKFSIEAPKKLYKSGFIDSMLFPFRKALFDKVVAQGFDIGVPDVQTTLKAGETKVELGTKQKEISGSNVLLCNPKVSWSAGKQSLTAAQKSPGNFDIIYKTDLDKLLGLDGATGMVKIEERKAKVQGEPAEQDVACALNYAAKSGLKFDLKTHPLRTMQESAKNDLKASVYVPLMKMDGGKTSVNMAAELMGKATNIVGAKYQVALAGVTPGMAGGLFYRQDDAAQAGVNLHKKMEVSGKPAEVAVEVFSPLSNLGGFSWLAAAQLKLNKDWSLNAKLNHATQLNLALKHQPHSSFSVQAGTLLRLNDLGTPGIGFKVVMKA